MAIGIRCLAFSQRLTNIAVHILQSLQSGCWIGLLSDRTLREFDVYPFHTGDLHESIRRHLADVDAWDDRSYSAHLRDVKSVLVIGAGGGREMLAWHRRGVSVTGVDFCPELVAATKEQLAAHGCHASLHSFPRYDLSSLTDTYDAIDLARVLQSSLFYRSQRLAMLRQLSDHLSPGGSLRTTFYIRNGNGLDWRLGKLLANVIRGLTFSRDPWIELGLHMDTDSPLTHHHYVRAEVESELQEAGLSLTHYETDWYGRAVAKRAH